MFKFAFRNVLRNKRRSFITGLSIFFAAIVSLLAIGWVAGILNLLMDNFIKYQTGNLRITSEGFVKREKFMPVDDFIPNSDNLIAQISRVHGVSSVEEREKFQIMLGWKDKTVFAVGMGLDLNHTAMDVKKRIRKGEKKPFLDLDESGIYIGKKLADKLRVVEGDSLLLATKTSEGGLNGIKLKIIKLFNFGISSFDSKFFYISLANSKKLLKLKHEATEIFVFFDKKVDPQSVKKQIDSLLPQGVISQSPREQIGAYYDTLKLSSIVFYFFICLILFMASFVIMNTMMMAIFERIREIGTLKAMGMKERELFLNFTLEGGIIGALGGLPGTIVGAVLLGLMHNVGIDMSASFKDMNMPMESVLRPDLTVFAVIFVLLAAIIIPTLAAMFPARYVRTLTPAEALRKV